MNPIFISYRRDDGQDTAQLLQMHLIHMFGEGTVFLDTDTLKAGDEFPTELQNAVTNAKVVIVMIGKNWKGDDPKVNRLEQEKDWVRKELEIALSDEKKKIIPVLVKGVTGISALLPLPSSIERLSKFNCTELREKEFRQDMIPLISLIEPLLQLKDPLKDLPLPENYDRYRYPTGSPFKGLDYFTETDAKLFFGRGAEIGKLFKKIKDFNILFLYGQSGCGKSSLLFAGLKPRMKFKGWMVETFRREAGINLAEKLNEYVRNTMDNSNQLVILDQVEEIFTNPDIKISPDVEAQQLLTSARNASEKIHILLSFRKEYLAEMKKLFTGIPVEEIYLEPLHTKGVLEAVTLSEEAKDTYELSFSDAEVPNAIAQTVLIDKESHVAPLLQVLLRKMWDKVENNKNRSFSKELLEEVKSTDLVGFLNDQVTSVKQNFANEVVSGLILDVLYFFTTARGTSATHTKEELNINYCNENILKVATELKNKYLLTEPTEKENDTDKNTIRLAHDSLAPLIRELYAQSNLPGQRASRLLESKRGDIEANFRVEFSKPDLLTIDAGKEGMRRITEMELQVIEQSRAQINKYELELEEKNKDLEIALTVAKEQTLQARAKALAATARAKLQTDPTIGLRLAEAACKITPVASKEAQSAFVDIMKQQFTFYKNMAGHTAGISSVAFSHDGKYILTGGYDNIAMLWNVNGILIQSFEGHIENITSVAFAPEGKYILTASRDKTVKLWNLDGTVRESFEVPVSATYPPGGNRIIVGGLDFTAKLQNIRQSLEGDILATFSPDGKSIITGSTDYTAKLWSLEGNLMQSFDGHKDTVNSVAVSPDEKYILTGSNDNTAKLWNWDGTLKQSFEGHALQVSSIAFSPDGKYILTGGYQTATFWNLDGTVIRSFDVHNSRISSLVYSPDGKSILTSSSDRTVKLWNLDGTMKTAFEGHTGGISSVAFAPDGNSILSGSDDGTAKLWNLNGMLKQSFEELNTVSSVAISPDGNFILCGCWDNTPKLWNLNSSEGLFYEGHENYISSVAFSPDGKCILTGSEDSTAKLWELDGTLIRSFDMHTDAVTSVAFFCKSKSILTGSKDSTAKLWDMDGTLIRSFEGHTGPVSSVAISCDEKWILTGSSDGTARLWNLDGRLQQSFETYAVNSVAFCPDGKCILTGEMSFTARLWNMDGTLMQAFDGHTALVNSVAFSPDGNWLLTGSDDNTAKLWSLDGSLRQSFEAHTEKVCSVVFSPDGKSILTGSWDESVKIWYPFWETLDPANTYVLSSEQMKEYDIPEDMEWGKIW